MLQDQLLLISGAIFLAVLLLLEGVIIVVRDARRHAERRSSRRARLQSVSPGGGAPPVQIRRPDLRGGRGPIAALARMLQQSGTSLSVRRLLVLVFAIGAGIWALVVHFTPASPVLSLVPAFSLGFALPLLALAQKRRRRLKRFAEQLPDALDMMVRSLRAGHPIKSAMALVAREMPDPIGTEIGMAVDEMTYGLELNEALDNLRRRVAHPDLYYTVVAINIQHTSGGNLAEILANLSTIIRDRYRLYKKVKALSAEGRLSGYVISGVPFFIAFVMTLNKRNYYLEAASHPAFPIVVLVAVVLYFGSVLAISKIVRIRV
jgi:tight adherence protein B